MVAAMLAVACLIRPRRAAGERLGAVVRADPNTPGPVPPPRRAAARSMLARLAAAAIVLCAGAAVIGGAVGLAVGLAAAAAVWLLRPIPAVESVDADGVAVVVDLVAGCLAAGAGLPDALDAAAVAADDVLRAACGAVAGALRSGTPPAEAWRPWLRDPWLGPVARTAQRTAQTGAAAAAELHRTSARLRARRRALAQRRVRQATVWLVVPLGLCFLPAFVLVAVVPIVIGLVPSLR